MTRTQVGRARRPQLDNYRSLLPLTSEAAAEQRPLPSSGLFCPRSPEGGPCVLSSKPPDTGRQADPTSELTCIRPGRSYKGSVLTLLCG